MRRESVVAVGCSILIGLGAIPFVTQPAGAETSYNVSCSFDLAGPGTADGPVYVYVTFVRSRSGASVKPLEVTYQNTTGRDLTLDVNRWQSADNSKVDRGPGGTISPHNTFSWFPVSYISLSARPEVYVSVHATTRPALSGGSRCKA